MKRLEVLESMRFVMIMQIVLSHLYFLGEVNGAVGIIYNYVFTNANCGVCFFFLLSGFGMTYASKTSDDYSLISLPYAIKRISKIYPLYIVSILLCLPITIYLAITLHGVTDGLVRTISKVPLALALLQSLTGMAGFSHAFNGVCWFISALFIIYIFYPLLNRFNNIIIKNSIKRVFGAIIIIIVINVVTYYILYEVQTSLSERSSYFDDLAYGTPYYRIFNFMLGILICDLYKKYQHNNYAKVIVSKLEIPVMILMSLYYIFRHEFDHLLYLQVFLDLFVPGILLFVFSFEQGRISGFLKNKYFLYLGSLSMYIFLFHSVAIGNIVPFIDLFTLSINDRAIISLLLVVVCTILLICFTENFYKKILHK